MTMQIMGKPYYDKQGYVYHKDYHSVYCDEEETEKAKILGKYKFINTNLFRHYHWLFKMSEPDELNKINDSTKMYSHDRIVFENRKSINFGIK
jgi:hypothetical protein